ncbi:hypothetical protein LY28_01552 [Ruminiclostridium sufflavum DSM 19573]|uniref:Uncharacterized protein n=1 Tax=Ruminiclostridium sufflavum DSM 19573 TaxID=1121337 RepID=A0A318XQ08_9FIRM|nr:hypothetical protein [Ruminiclostridium sufflavum]PYG88215.1 hypothetical protein LY28_01552 [Ruminiclostridium sufflavum DSM 19573]
MFYGKARRVIVINDICSNLFESAILVLKEEKEREEKCTILNSDKHNNVKKDFILKEAEAIINSYIKENKCKLHPPEKKEKANNKFIKNIIINSALIGSVAAVVFLLMKLF